MHFSLVAMEVMAALESESALDGDLAVQSALLHDTLEDTAATYGQLMDRFGPGVADGVQALTKNDDLGSGLPPAECSRIRMADSLKRIQGQPQEIWMVKMADRITNLQPPPKGWSEEKIDRYRLEAVEIHQALKEASPCLAHRLQNKIAIYPG
jgi:(p)ppGpp synthase/HD superfamily hydrolase